MSNTSIVADSSYIVEALLSDNSLIERYDDIYFLGHGVAEVINAIWKHQATLQKINLLGSRQIITFFFNFISTKQIKVVNLGKMGFLDAYDLSAKTKLAIYDAAFIIFARSLDLELKTFDKRQAQVYKQHHQKQQ